MWRNDKRKKSGGYWACSVKRHSLQRKSDKKYRQTERGQINRRLQEKRYRETVKGYVTRRRRELDAMRVKYTLQLEEIRNGR